MVNGKTKSGIGFEIDERVKNDTRFLQYIVEMQSKDTEVQTVALFDMLKLLFGGREGLICFQNAVATTHDGFSEPEIMMSELNEILGALGIKKS